MIQSACPQNNFQQGLQLMEQQLMTTLQGYMQSIPREPTTEQQIGLQHARIRPPQAVILPDIRSTLSLLFSLCQR